MAEAKKEVLGRIRLEGVRLSFARDLWTARDMQGNEGTPKARNKANFLIAKDGDLTARYRGERVPIMQGIKRAKIDAIARKLDVSQDKAAQVKIKPENYACRDGDDETWDGYEGCWYVSAASTRKPAVIGRDKRPIAEGDGTLYAGCYVNAIVTFWHQTAGKKDDETVPSAVWAALEAVQFVRAGEAFGAGAVDVDEEFDDITDDSDTVGDEDFDGAGADDVL